MRLLSLDPEDTLKVLAVQAVAAQPDSLLLIDSPALGTDGTEEGAGAGSLFLHIGAPFYYFCTITFVLYYNVCYKVALRTFDNITRCTSSLLLQRTAPKKAWVS